MQQCKDAATGIGGNPVSVENEQDDAGRDGRNRLARPNSQARTKTGKYSFFLFSGQQAELATLPG